MYAYDKHLQFKDPREDMVAFRKICAPVVYAGYGKTISHFGGLRIAPHQATEYAGWGKAKQFAWDRAPNKDGELCYICYYDAGNTVYAGFVRSILTPEDRRELYNGVTDPREEVLGDTLELVLGVLTLATRYPSHFINWGGSEDANACARDLERSIWRYAAAEAIELITADQPRARTRPKQDAEVTAYISNSTQGLNVTFEAVVDGDVFTASAEGNNESTEVAVAPPMPEETTEADQPEEEEGETVDPAQELHDAIRQRMMQNLDELADGIVTTNQRVLTCCVACGDPRHVLDDCEFIPARKRKESKRQSGLCATPSTAARNINQGHLEREQHPMFRCKVPMKGCPWMRRPEVQLHLPNS